MNFSSGFASDGKIARRSVLGGYLAVSACATPIGRGPTQALPDTPIQGKAMLSQSVMLTGATMSGDHFVAIRACQYRDAGVTWLWASVLTPDGFYQFVSNNLPWQGPFLTEAAATRATYQAECRTCRLRASASYLREGTLSAPLSATLNASFDSDVALGAAQGRVSVEAVFTPISGFAGLLPGRTEAFGQCRFNIRIGNKTLSFEGPSQFHEQSQTDARFVQPFVFSSLWSGDLFSTLLDSPPNSGGYVIEDGKPRGLRNPIARISSSSSEFTFLDADQERVVRFEVIKSFHIPIYGSLWRGRFVRGELLGRPIVGTLNSWLRTP
jgi:hypothetical protein